MKIKINKQIIMNTTRKFNKRTIIVCLEFLDNLKLFHWNTRSYSEHMASDQLYEDLTKKIDRLIESILQVRVPIKATITINTSDFS